MKTNVTKLQGVIEIETDIFSDNRGWFYESYNQSKYVELGISDTFVQDNHSLSRKKGTIRGLHLQNAPFSQSKLVRCTKGAILDVIVNIDVASSDYKKWIMIELSEDNKKQVYIPHGYAHGFITLTDNAEVNYKVDNFYNKASEVTVLYNDADIAIDWKTENPIVSEKDAKGEMLKNCKIILNV